MIIPMVVMLLCSEAAGQNGPRLPLLFRHNVRTEGTSDFTGVMWTDCTLVNRGTPIKAGFRFNDLKKEIQGAVDAEIVFRFFRNGKQEMEIKCRERLKDIGYKSGYREVDYVTTDAAPRASREVTPSPNMRESYLSIPSTSKLMRGTYRIAVIVTVGKKRFAYKDLELDVDDVAR